MKTKKTILHPAAALILILFIALFTACEVFGEKGDGTVTKETRSVPSFNAIDVSGAFDVYITQGTTQSVVVETDENLQKLVKTRVEGSTLEIETKDPISHFTCMKVHLTVTDLRKIDVSGAVNIVTENRLAVADLMIDASGAAEAKMDLAVDKLGIDCSGGSKLKFSGTAKVLSLDASGAVDLFAFDLQTESADIEISGAGKAEISVSKSLSAEISGAGSVRYKGKPEKVMASASGAGTIKPVD